MPVVIELTDRDIEYLKRGNSIMKIVTDKITIVIKHRVVST